MDLIHRYSERDSTEMQEVGIGQVRYLLERILKLFKNVWMSESNLYDTHFRGWNVFSCVLCKTASALTQSWRSAFLNIMFHLMDHCLDYLGGNKQLFCVPYNYNAVLLFPQVSKTKDAVFDICLGEAPVPNCLFPLSLVLFSKVDDLAVGRYVHFPPPSPPPTPLAASKAVAYHVSRTQCNTMPGTNRPGTAVLDDLSLYGVNGWCCSSTAQWQKVETKNLKVKFKVFSSTLCVYASLQPSARQVKSW